MILWSHNDLLSRRMRYPYEFIVVNGETTTSAFPKVVQLHISGVVKCLHISV